MGIVDGKGINSALDNLNVEELPKLSRVSILDVGSNTIHFTWSPPGCQDTALDGHQQPRQLPCVHRGASAVDLRRPERLVRRERRGASKIVYPTTTSYTSTSTSTTTTSASTPIFSPYEMGNPTQNELPCYDSCERTRSTCVWDNTADRLCNGVRQF